MPRVSAFPIAARRPRDLRIVRDFAAGRPREEIAAAHGVSTRTVSAIAHRHGVKRPRGRPSAWPECPPSHQSDYRLLQRYFGAAEARALVERELGQ